MAAIVGAFTKHMQSVKTTDVPAATITLAPTSTPAPSSSSTASSLSPTATTAAGEYEMFCRHMQKTTKLSENGEFCLKIEQ